MSNLEFHEMDFFQIVVTRPLDGIYYHLNLKKRDWFENILFDSPGKIEFIQKELLKVSNAVLVDNCSSIDGLKLKSEKLTKYIL